MKLKRKLTSPFAIATCLTFVLSTWAAANFIEEWKSGIAWLEPAVVDPGNSETPPSDAIVLFDGKDLSQWEQEGGWTIEDGIISAGGKGGMTTKQSFGDCQLHVEWASPTKVKGNGQGRGNSGIYLMKLYEVQILDSYDNKTYFDGQCAAVYKQYPPLVNACRKPGEWQTYDILFTAPRFCETGSLKSPAYVTVIHNGVVVQNHVELQGGTFWATPPEYKKHAEKQPIFIQNHGNPVRFRNIWLRELKQLPGKKT